MTKTKQAPNKASKGKSAGAPLPEASSRDERLAAGKALREKLNNYRAGTPDYNDLEAKIAKDSAELNVRYQLQKKEFAKIEAKITKNTVAIMPVHIIGGVCDIDRINADVQSFYGV